MAAALVSLYWPVEKWLDNRRVLRRGRESAVVLFRFLERSGGVGQVVGAEFLSPLSRQLEFDNVTLREPGTNRPLLQDVSLTIEAGQKVALVGSDDLEKHALVYLIPRFLDPTTGEIRVDAHNLRWVTLDSLRAQIAIVLQHNLVFNDTVSNNIGCGDQAYTLPQIIEAAKIAHAHQFIQKLPKGYDTPIGELGHALNIGEQFRIALARAVLRDPARTPAARMLADMRGHGGSYRDFVLAQSRRHRAALLTLPFAPADSGRFAALAAQSIAEQKAIEAGDTLPFEEYRRRYLAVERLNI